MKGVPNWDRKRVGMAADMRMRRGRVYKRLLAVTRGAGARRAEFVEYFGPENAKN